MTPISAFVEELSTLEILVAPYGVTGGMSSGFGGGVGEGGKGLGVGGGIGEGGIGSGDGEGTGSGGIGSGGNGSTSGDLVMESDSARQGNDRRSANTNWAVTAADNPHMLLRVFIDIDHNPFVACLERGDSRKRNVLWALVGCLTTPGLLHGSRSSALLRANHPDRTHSLARVVRRANRLRLRSSVDPSWLSLECPKMLPPPR